MALTASLLASLESISAETSRMLNYLDQAPLLPPGDRHELKRRVFAIREETQELFEWLSAVLAAGPDEDRVLRERRG
jgi:hypothetical protein